MSDLTYSLSTNLRYYVRVGLARPTWNTHGVEYGELEKGFQLILVFPMFLLNGHAPLLRLAKSEAWEISQKSGFLVVYGCRSSCVRP